MDYKGIYEVDVSVGIPTAWLFSSAVGLEGTFFRLLPGTDLVEPGDNYYSIVPNLRAEYGYNILSWLNVGIAFNYSSCAYPMNYPDTGEYAWTEGLGMTTITANLKFYWFNREWVRMYFAIRAGVGIVRTNSVAIDIEDASDFLQFAVLLRICA